MNVLIIGVMGSNDHLLVHCSYQGLNTEKNECLSLIALNHYPQHIMRVCILFSATDSSLPFFIKLVTASEKFSIID